MNVKRRVYSKSDTVNKTLNGNEKLKHMRDPPAREPLAKFFVGSY